MLQSHFHFHILAKEIKEFGANSGLGNNYGRWRSAKRGSVIGKSQLLGKTSWEGFTFISPCCFGHLIKKGHKTGFSITEPIQKKKEKKPTIV